MAEGVRETADGVFNADAFYFGDNDSSSYPRLPTSRRKRRKTNKRRPKNNRRSGVRRVTRHKRKRHSRKSRVKLRRSKTSRRSRSGKIHYTKRGQPYILNKFGRARFIKRR